MALTAHISVSTEAKDDGCSAGVGEKEGNDIWVPVGIRYRQRRFSHSFGAVCHWQ